jgi:histidyl-tRNA synthetase
MHQTCSDCLPAADVIVVNHDAPEEANALFEQLWKDGFDATLLGDQVSVITQLEMARDCDIPLAVIVSKKDIKGGKVVVKAMATGKYEKVKVKALRNYLDRRLQKESEAPF